MPSVKTAAQLALGGLLLIPVMSHAQAAKAHVMSAAASGPLPLKYTGKPTTAPISAADLMTRLYIFADDSMMGRQVGTEYNLKGTAYIEREVRRIGLVPAGENGGYFQNIPLFAYRPDSASTMRVAGQTFVFGTDFLPLARSEKRVPLDGTPVVYGGSVADSTTWISADAAAG